MVFSDLNASDPLVPWIRHSPGVRPHEPSCCVHSRSRSGDAATCGSAYITDVTQIHAQSHHAASAKWESTRGSTRRAAGRTRGASTTRPSSERRDGTARRAPAELPHPTGVPQGSAAGLGQGRAPPPRGAINTGAAGTSAHSEAPELRGRTGCDPPPHQHQPGGSARGLRGRGTAARVSGDQQHPPVTEGK